MSKVSKKILDNINQNVRRASGLIQWKDSQEVLNWFNRIEAKQDKRFICFDIVSFYPSILRKHLTEALAFASEYVTISEKDTETILHACKSVLFSHDEAWKKKKNEDGLFDIPMGSFHGAEVCDLVGLHILRRLQIEIPDGEFGLYRDDGLGIIKNMPKPDFERLTKKVRKMFKEIGFQITIETGAMITNFLDVTLNLRSNSFNPYRKTNSSISYIHHCSNHPPHVKKALPRMVERRLTSLSKDKATFDRHKTDYESALKNSGYKEHNLTYTEPGNQVKRKTRRRRKMAIFFNAPFCASVRTKFGKEFFKIVDRHFSKSHPYYAIFNRKTIKLSYSCLANMAAIIKSHNSYVLGAKEQLKTPPKMCNCPKSKKTQCPLQQQCLAQNIIYKATVRTSTDEKEYVGSTGRTFKKRFSEHSHALRHRGSQQTTTLSKYVWKARDEGKDPVVTWSLVHKIPLPRGPQRVCTTCNLEKMEIAAADRRRSLNKRSELTGKCVHFKSFYF